MRNRSQRRRLGKKPLVFLPKTAAVFGHAANPHVSRIIFAAVQTILLNPFAHLLFTPTLKGSLAQNTTVEANQPELQLEERSLKSDRHSLALPSSKRQMALPARTVCWKRPTVPQKEDPGAEAEASLCERRCNGGLVGQQSTWPVVEEKSAAWSSHEHAEPQGTSRLPEKEEIPFRNCQTDVGLKVSGPPSLPRQQTVRRRQAVGHLTKIKLAQHIS